MKWFRMYTEIVDDPKMSDLSDREFRLFVSLLCVASEREKDGVINLCPDKIAWRIRASVKEVISLQEKLIQLKILNNNGVGVEFIHWKERQFRSDNSTDRWRKWKDSNVCTNVGKLLAPTATETETETEKDTTLVVSQRTDDVKSVPKSVPDCPHEEIVNLYHKVLPELPKVKIWTDKRKGYLRSRWREDPKRQNLEWWKRYFNHVRKSSFLMGNGDKHWTPGLEWLCKESNLINVIEGKYNDR